VLRRLRKLLGRRKYRATTAAATTDKQRFPGVLRLQDEAFLIGSVQQLEHFLPADGSALADAHHLSRRHTQREAVLLEAGLLALLSQQFPAVAADAIHGGEGTAVGFDIAAYILVRRHIALDGDGLVDGHGPQLGGLLTVRCLCVGPQYVLAAIPFQ